MPYEYSVRGPGWLECRPRLDPRSGHVKEATNKCISEWINNSMFFNLKKKEKLELHL